MVALPLLRPARSPAPARDRLDRLDAHSKRAWRANGSRQFQPCAAPLPWPPWPNRLLQWWWSLGFAGCFDAFMDDPPGKTMHGASPTESEAETDAGSLADGAAAAAPPSPPLPPSPPPSRSSSPVATADFDAWLLSNARPSPETAAIAGPTSFVTPTALQHAANAMGEVYAHVVRTGGWITDFDRGERPLTKLQRRFRVGAPPVRRLATRHLGPPGTDGWNALVGATELARAWALPSASPPLDVDEQLPMLDRATRMRTAVCLATAWHFQRASSSRFPRDVAADAAPASVAGEGVFSFELARLGYLFLYRPERERLGGWPIPLVVEMQTALVRLQAELLVGAPVFTLVANNPQVVSEARLEAIARDNSAMLTLADALTARAVVPLFVRSCWLAAGGELYARVFAETPVDVGGGALACVAWAVTSRRTDAQAALVARFFSRREQCLAATILATACAHNGHAHTGCYAEPSFFAYEYVAVPSLRDARDRLLRATGCVRA